MPKMETPFFLIAIFVFLSSWLIPSDIWAKESVSESKIVHLFHHKNLDIETKCQFGDLGPFGYHGRPLNPSCWQIVQSVKLDIHACSYIKLVIPGHIHIDFFYFLTFFNMEIVNLVNLRHLVTPHVRPLTPSPPMSAWLVLPVIFEGESMAESETISFFFIFFSPLLLISMPSANLAILSHFATPYGQPLNPSPSV